MAAEDRAEPKSWQDSIAPYVRPRPLAAFLLGISSGFPLTLLLSTMTLWLARVGIDKKTIGFAIGLTTPYTLKFLWAPLIDRTNLPLLTRWFGQRRSWLFLVQALLFGSVWMLGFSAPQQQHLNAFLIWAITTAFLAATQDIVIDAYRIEILSEAELPFGTANNQFGYRVGGLVAGVGTIWLASPQGLHLGWGLAYGLTGLCVLPGALAALWAGPGLHQRALAAEDRARPVRSFGQWLDETIVGPFREFFTRNSIAGVSLIMAFILSLILALIVLYKIGGVIGQGALNPMPVDFHFSNTTIMVVNRVLGVLAVAVGIALTPPFMAWLGMRQALFFSGLLMAFTSFTYAILAWHGHSGVWLAVVWLAIAVSAEEIASGIGMAVFVICLSKLPPVRSFGQWLDETIVGPFREFFTRNGVTGASLILAFIILYKIGDAMGQGMLNPMLVDLRFTDIEIMTVNKMLGVSGVMVGIALAPPFMAWLGMSRALFLSGLLMMLTNFTYVILAWQGHSVAWLAIAVGTEQVASGIGSAVFVTYLSELSSVAYTATQYALLSSLAGIGRTWLSTPSGYAAKELGWPHFWLLAMAAALPGLGLLWLLWRRGFVVDSPRRKVTTER